MQYLLLIYEDESARKGASQAALGEVIAAYGAYIEAMKTAGHYLGGNRLRPVATATSVRISDGKKQVLDGPYVETKEQLGGYCLIDVPDLDAALSWAARCPGASLGTIEVRPIWDVYP
ncbi:MAG: YciI family protein [Rhizobiales bacterium]|nr:YciI family protein [Hyphomicrobiales bacterium]